MLQLYTFHLVLKTLKKPSRFSNSHWASVIGLAYGHKKIII